MPISGIPAVVDGDIFAAATWTNMKNAVEGKFNAGITGADFAYPLNLSGAVNLTGFALNRVGTLNKAYNLAEAATAQGLFDAINADAGGTCFVPSDTNISMGAVTVKGSSVWITGHGPSSVITISGSPADWITTSTNTSLITFSNLTFNANNVNTNIIKLVRTARVRFINCIFQNFAGAAINITNDGTPGNFCDAVSIENCFFTAGAGSAILLIDCKNVMVKGNYFLDQTGLGTIKATPAGVSNVIQNVSITGNYFRPTNTTTVNSISIDGIVASTVQLDLDISENFFDGGSADTQAYVFVNNIPHTSVSRNKFKNCTTVAPAVNIRATSAAINYPTVSDNVFFSLSGDAIAVGTPGGTTATVDAAEVVSRGTFQNNKNLAVARRLLILNNPDDIIISGNISDQASAVTLAGTNGVVEFWGLAATPTALRINFINNILGLNTGIKGFSTSTTGHGGARAAIGSGAADTWTNFSHNYVNLFDASDVAVTTAANFHVNEDNT